MLEVCNHAAHMPETEIDADRGARPLRQRNRGCGPASAGNGHRFHFLDQPLLDQSADGTRYGGARDTDPASQIGTAERSGLLQEGDDLMPNVLAAKRWLHGRTFAERPSASII